MCVEGYRFGWPHWCSYEVHVGSMLAPFRFRFRTISESKPSFFSIQESTYDLIDYCISWCACSNENESKYLIQKIQQEKDIFLGEFIKAILKINNIVNELEKIANYVQNIPLLSKLTEIKQNTLKFVATTQSLYV